MPTNLSCLLLGGGHGPICQTPHSVLPDAVLASHEHAGRNKAKWSAAINETDYPALWAVMQQNSAIIDYFKDALWATGHTGQVTAEVTHLRKLFLGMEPRANVVCESGFNAGHSAVIWLEPPSTARLHSFDMGVEPYSETAQAFVQRLYPGRLTFHKGNSMQTMPKHAASVEADASPPCDLWFIDGGHEARVPRSDMESAWRAARDGALVIADDCTGRFQDVRNAWRAMIAQGKIVPLNGTKIPGDGGSGRLVQRRAPPGQPSLKDRPTEYSKPYMYIVGIKGWCSGYFVKPARGDPGTDGRRLQPRESGSTPGYDYTSQQSHPENHHSPMGCNSDFFTWISSVAHKMNGSGDKSAPLEVLDVGGGDGNLGQETKRRSINVAWDCIDIVKRDRCKQFDGRTLPHANNSKDVVVFNYVLHHAADETISLLAHAQRVARKYVIVVEDLKGTTPNETMRQWDHEWHGTYRGTTEWRAIFNLLNLKVAQEFTIRATCYTHKPPWRPTFKHPLTWPRGMFVLEHDPAPTILQ